MSGSCFLKRDLSGAEAVYMPMTIAEQQRPLVVEPANGAVVAPTALEQRDGLAAERIVFVPEIGEGLGRNESLGGGRGGEWRCERRRTGPRRGVWRRASAANGVGRPPVSWRAASSLVLSTSSSTSSEKFRGRTLSWVSISGA